MKKLFIRHVCKNGKVFNSISYKSRKRYLVKWWYRKVFLYKLRKDIKKINYRTLRRLYREDYLQLIKNRRV